METLSLIHIYSMTFEDYRNQILAMDQEEYEAFRDKYAESIVFDTMVLYACLLYTS